MKDTELKFEGAIRRIAVLMANREKEKAKRHMKRILPHYDEMTDLEKEVIDEQRIRLFI